MPGKSVQWTEKGIKDFQYAVASDFAIQVENRLEELGLKQADFAKKLQLTESRVSQIINNPGNMTLSSMIRWSRAVGLKLTVLAYDDDDAENIRGPIIADVFRICWEKCGKPADFWTFEKKADTKAVRCLTTWSSEHQTDKLALDLVATQLYCFSAKTVAGDRWQVLESVRKKPLLQMHLVPAMTTVGNTRIVAGVM